MVKELISNNLKIAKKQWIDKLRCKKVKLENFVEKIKRKQDSIKFQRDQKDFFNWKETRPEKEKCLRLRDSSNFVVVFGRKLKEHQRCPG